MESAVYWGSEADAENDEIILLLEAEILRDKALLNSLSNGDADLF